MGKRNKLISWEIVTEENRWKQENCELLAQN